MFAGLKFGSLFSTLLELLDFEEIVLVFYVLKGIGPALEDIKACDPLNPNDCEDLDELVANIHNGLPKKLKERATEQELEGLVRSTIGTVKYAKAVLKK